MGFTLYGGTAIALRLGHRQSVDFDFFTEKPLDKFALAAAFPIASTATVLQDQPNTWTLLVQPESSAPETVKLSFFGTIGFGRFGEPEWTQDGALLVASLDDLMATKLKVVLQRVECKDYQDIAAMLRAGVSLETGLSIAREMFGNSFQPSESVKAMTWFEGGDLDALAEPDRVLLIEKASAIRKLPMVLRVSPSLGLD